MAANTHGADINELAFGFFLNGGKWFSPEARTQFEMKKKLVSSDEVIHQMGRAQVMADAVFGLLKSKYHGTKIKQVWWTARPGSLAAACKNSEADSRKNPTDILILTTNGDYIGFSAKSTSGSGDIGFKNPGLGTIEKILNLTLTPILEKAVTQVVSQYKLPISAGARKEMIRKKPVIQAATTALGDKVLVAIRTALMKKLKSLSQTELRKHLLTHWMDSSTGLFPPYYKVTGHGTKVPYTASLSDPLNNPKLTAAKSEKLVLIESGASGIGVMAGSVKLLKMRAKFESEKLASGIKFSGEPL